MARYGEGEGQWLHVKGLEKFYEGRRIFQNFTVDIPLDRRVVICGENGSGKTTFLRIAAGEAWVEHGTVWSDGGYWEALIAGAGIFFLPQECPGLNFSIRDLLGTEKESFYRLAGQFGLDGDMLYRPLNGEVQYRVENDPNQFRLILVFMAKYVLCTVISLPALIVVLGKIAPAMLLTVAVLSIVKWLASEKMGKLSAKGTQAEREFNTRLRNC